MHHARRMLSVGLCLGFALAAASVRGQDGPIDYNRQIRPILSNVCYQCHGPDENQRQAGLRLDQKEAAFGPLESGHRAVVPGDPAQSEMVRRLTAEDPDLRMPPADSGKSLSEDQIALIRRWIEQGAPWREHWSLVPPQRPEPPAVKHESLVRNPIDRFVLARLESEGLTPSPPADKESLLRRVTLDLTGLPPTPQEIDAFLADSSPDAYRKVVDRLLDSPRYGEHMARYWLDAARYGDTHGLHFDNERALWPYRQWVIDAFNRNMPFDRFTIEQLAGDLLPNPTTEQIVATGFNRCNVTTSEGGSIAEEVLVRYGVDRVETMSTVWMGLTMGCAVCHDHKYDPFTQRDFYQLFAFFAGINEQAMDGNQLAPPPVLKIPSPEQQQQQQALNQRVAEIQQRIAEELAKIQYQDPAAGQDTSAASQPQEYVWIDDQLPPGAKAQGEAPGWQFVAAPDHPVLSGQKSHTRQSAGLSQHFFTGAEPGLRVGEGDKLFAYVYIDPLEQPKEIMLQFNDGSWEHRCYWGEDVIPWGMADTPGRVKMGPLPEVGAWVRLEVEAAKVGLKPGATINGWAFTQHGGTVWWDKAGIVTRTPQHGQGFESQLVWEAYERGQSKSTLPQPVQDALKVDAAQRNDQQKQLLRHHFLEHVYVGTRETFQPLHQQLAEAQQKIKELDAAIPVTMVTQEMAQPRDTFILIRGQYNKKGDKVSPGTPQALPPMPEGAPRNRLGLAQWLVQPEHPLVSRVIVNRFWQQYFGRGIVETAEDFGSQGSWPTHPQLLDWLAGHFIDSGWDVKGLQRLIVTSYTYQQDSRLTAELAQRDPENKLYARGPRFRLDAEMIRDAALAASGLLAEQLGGRSVKPYQPPGLWEAVAFVGSNTQNYKQDEGDAVYRRSVYTFWKRTSPPASLLMFDAPSRETCVVRRARTNTPLQALALLNDTQYVEAARKLAERMCREGGSGLDDRLVWGFRLTTSRRPHEDELAVLRRVYAQSLAEFQADAEAAKKLLAVGQSPADASLDPKELAALTVVGNLMLNLDESISKR